MSIRDQVARSLHSGFVDQSAISLEEYKPKLLVNNHLKGQKVLSSIVSELNACDEFFFSVAFITYSGLLVLLNTLKVLEEKGIKGKIVASKYLNFTDPKALEKILTFKNIDLRIVVEDNLHSKGYIFKKDDHYKMIIGSSNLTQNALCSNKEWNLKISSMDQGSIVTETLKEFEKTFMSGIEVTHDWIDAYTAIYHKNKVQQAFNQAAIMDHTAGSLPTSISVIQPNAMQAEALKGIEFIRAKGEDRALLISATGTGKTYLAAFDVATVKPKRFLLLAHREQLLNQAIESFKNVLGHGLDLGKVSGSHKDYGHQFTFSTIQSMSKKTILDQIPADYFDYIVIDESHKAGSASYQKILNYFKPDFLLGMTATPERGDDHNICEDFNYNIAYEIRLEEAMREKMLSPFHYFGISDGQGISETSSFKDLTSDQRIDNILKKIDFYGYDGDHVRGLVFCSRNDEAEVVSQAFNGKGYKTVALSGKNSQAEREEAIRRLESDRPQERLDYIFTVDIFNEGVDIPKVNQVVMLRATKSPIVFVQQLGRGLRKVANKSYVVILDFIGNYKNNFLIPIALSDDRSYNKDTIRRFVAEGNKIIPGSTTINFDEISKRKIYDSIDTANFSSVNFIKDQYKNLKYRLGHIPSLMDFERYDSLDIARIVDTKSLRSYHKFLSKYEGDYKIKFNKIQALFIECVSTKFLKGKRPHELLVLEAILQGKKDICAYMTQQLTDVYGIAVKDKTLVNVINIMTNAFASGSSKKTYEEAIFIEKTKGTYHTSEQLKNCLLDRHFLEVMEELVSVGLYRNHKYYGHRYKNSSLQLYQKYTYEDVCRLLEWEKNIVSLNIGGYKYDQKSKTYPVFINYHKDDHISETLKYEDRFLSNNRLIAISKAKRTIESNDIITAYKARALGVAIELFVRKNKNDQGSKEFYYLGQIETIGDPKSIRMNQDGPNAVELTYELDVPVREDIYDFITQA